jgi:hypothetical protein
MGTTVPTLEKIILFMKPTPDCSSVAAFFHPYGIRIRWTCELGLIHE